MRAPHTHTSRRYVRVQVHATLGLDRCADMCFAGCAPMSRSTLRSVNYSARQLGSQRCGGTTYSSAGTMIAPTHMRSCATNGAVGLDPIRPHSLLGVCTADRTALHCRLFDEMYVKVNELYGMTECSAVQTISLGNVRAPKSIA